MSDTDTTEPNLYQASARNQKAGQLAAVFVGYYAARGALAQADAALATLGDDYWDRTALLLGINPPSEETKEATRVYVSNAVKVLRQMEAGRG